jgi:cell division protein FtsB
LERDIKALGESMKLQKKLAKIITGFVIVYLLFSGNRGLWNLYKLHQEKQNLAEQINQLKIEVNRYQVEYQTLQRNPLVVEKQAREELNLVKPGEMVYKF